MVGSSRLLPLGETASPAGHGAYFPCLVASTFGGAIQPGTSGDVLLRAVMRPDDLSLPSGTRIELREALHVFADGELLSIVGDALPSTSP